LSVLFFVNATDWLREPNFLDSSKEVPEFPKGERGNSSVMGEELEVRCTL
jgi:hypothetical protein